MQNLSAIVWLYRGEPERFLALVRRYLASICNKSAAIADKLSAFEESLADLRERFSVLNRTLERLDDLDAGKKQAMTEAVVELHDAVEPYETDRARLIADLDSFDREFAEALPQTNEKQHAARKVFDPISDAIRGLTKQVDLLYKLTARAADLGGELSGHLNNLPLPGLAEGAFDRRTASKLVKQLDERRKSVVEELKHAVYFHRQVAWLQDRFPNTELQAVSGLVRLVDRTEIEAADWSLTPGRYVGVAPPEEDEDFDFEQTLRDIHIELADLNKEAAELAAKIQENFEELSA
jgi:type I restriction enzyme M protein